MKPKVFTYTNLTDAATLAPLQDNGLQQLQEGKGTFFTPWSSTPTEVGPADFTSTPVDPAAVVPGEAKPYGLRVDADHRGGTTPTIDASSDE